MDNYNLYIIGNHIFQFNGVLGFWPWFGLTDEAFGAREWKLGFAYTVRTCYGP